MYKFCCIIIMSIYDNMEGLRSEFQCLNAEQLHNRRDTTEENLRFDKEDLRSELQGLSAEQLHDLRDTIEEELEGLEQYSDYWNEFNAKYRASLDSLDMLSKINTNENTTLIKLGNHVFTPGKLIKSNKVLVYLGDGYYAKMVLEDAKMFFQRKTEGLLKDLQEYEEGNNNKHYLFMLLQETLEDKIREQMDNLLHESQKQTLNSPNLASHK